MEPTDIDKIIKDKILEGSELHEQEMDSAKPFIWTAVQNQIGKKKSLTWYHLAAAILLLMISFSFVLFSIQKSHKNEMILLSDKIDQLQRNYLSQVEQLNWKDNQVESLGSELKNVELQLTDLQEKKPLSQKETIVFRTDTVYLKQVEYITSVSGPVETKKITATSVVEQSVSLETANKQEREIDHVIFPSYSNQGKRQQSESIKFKFGSLTAKRN